MRDRNSAPKAGRSLKFVVASMLGAVALMAIGILGVILEQAMRREAQNHVSERLNELAFQMRYRLDRSMFERYRDIQIASTLIGLQTGSIGLRRHIIDRLKESYTDYAWIGVTDADGRVVLATNGLLEGESVASRPWFSGSQGGPYVGDVHEAVLLEKLLSPPSDTKVGRLRFVDVAAPINGPGGIFLGVIAAHLDWRWANEVVASIVREGSAADSIDVFLMDKNGTVLLGPNGGYGQMRPCGNIDLRSGEVPAGKIVTCSDGRKYFAAQTESIGYRTYPGLGWNILIRQPADLALAQVNKLRVELILIGFVLSVFFVIGGWFLAAWISEPLSSIARAATRMRNGELFSELPSVHQYAEVVSLSASLKALVDSLVRSEKRLLSSATENERRQIFLSTILESMSDALFVNVDGRVTFTNAACCRLFGAGSSDEIVGLSPLSLFHIDCHALIQERISQLMSGQSSTVPTVEEKIVTLQGNVIEVEATATSFREGGQIAILVILRDISEKKRTDRQLSHAQRLEAVGHLTGGLAHDFNNLLTVIIGNLDLLSDDLSEQPDTQQLAAAAMSASLRGAELTRQLLAFSRRQSLDPKSFQMNDIVASTIDLLRRTIGEQIEIRLRLSQSLWQAVADPAQVESALTNLAINARDAMPGGGVLTISTENVFLDDDYAKENVEVEPGDYVMLAISDTGTGIPQEILGRVFEPFFTTKSDGKGSGLGLSMIYGFAKQSRGHVKIYSEEGHGTTVRLYIPRAQTSDAKTDRSDSFVAPDTIPKAVIFVVEDKADVRAVVVRQLTEIGYRTIEASCPADALALLEQDIEFDLLLTDIVMPGNKTGLDLAQEVCRLRPGTKVIFTSGFAEVNNDRNKDARILGPLLSKPYRKQELANLVYAVLGETHRDP